MLTSACLRWFSGSCQQESAWLSTKITTGKLSILKISLQLLLLLGKASNVGEAAIIFALVPHTDVSCHATAMISGGMVCLYHYHEKRTLNLPTRRADSIDDLQLLSLE